MTTKRLSVPTVSQMVELMTEPFVIIDRQYRIISANQRYCDHYGTRPEDLVGRHCYEVSHHSDVPCHQNGEHCPLVEVFLKRQATNVIHVHYDKDGKEERVQLNATPLKGADGEVEYMGESILPLRSAPGPDEFMVGRSGVMLQLLSMLQRVAPTPTTVLLEGESGCGKECTAKYIHQYSERPNGHFVVVDCASLADGAAEQELFGVEKGAHSAVTNTRKGLLEAADGGTLYLDEVCELPMPMQTRLLRFIETSTFRRLGGSAYRRIDTRIIASSTRSLGAMVESGSFRQDLYYRLSAFPISIPPLRDRLDDVPRLAEFLLTRIEGGSRHLPLTVEVIQALLGYDYPGNVRELRNILERATVLAGEDMIEPRHLLFDRVRVSESTAVPGETAAAMREKRILNALKSNAWNRGRTARALGISERTVYRYIRKLRDKYGDDIEVMQDAG